MTEISGGLPPRSAESTQGKIVTFSPQRHLKRQHWDGIARDLATEWFTTQRKYGIVANVRTFAPEAKEAMPGEINDQDLTDLVQAAKTEKEKGNLEKFTTIARTIQIFDPHHPFLTAPDPDSSSNNSTDYDLLRIEIGQRQNSSKIADLFYLLPIRTETAVLFPEKRAELAPEWFKDVVARKLWQQRINNEWISFIRDVARARILFGEIPGKPLTPKEWGYMLTLLDDTSDGTDSAQKAANLAIIGAKEVTITDEDGLKVTPYDESAIADIDKNSIFPPIPVWGEINLPVETDQRLLEREKDEWKKALGELEEEILKKMYISAFPREYFSLQDLGGYLLAYFKNPTDFESDPSRWEELAFSANRVQRITHKAVFLPSAIRFGLVKRRNQLRQTQDYPRSAELALDIQMLSSEDADLDLTSEEDRIVTNRLEMLLANRDTEFTGMTQFAGRNFKEISLDTVRMRLLWERTGVEGPFILPEIPHADVPDAPQDTENLDEESEPSQSGQTSRRAFLGNAAKVGPSAIGAVAATVAGGALINRVKRSGLFSPSHVEAKPPPQPTKEQRLQKEFPDYFELHNLVKEEVTPELSAQFDEFLYNCFNEPARTLYKDLIKITNSTSSRDGSKFIEYNVSFGTRNSDDYNSRADLKISRVINSDGTVASKNITFFVDKNGKMATDPVQLTQVVLTKEELKPSIGKALNLGQTPDAEWAYYLFGGGLPGQGSLVRDFASADSFTRHMISQDGRITYSRQNR